MQLSLLFIVLLEAWEHDNMRNKGFSLIELIVVIAVMGILLGIATVNFTSVQRETTLTSTVETALTDINQQQIKAMVGDTEGRTIPDTYGIYFETNSYTLFHGTYSAVEPSNFEVTLPDSQQITTTFPGNQIVFERGSGDISSFNELGNTITIQDTVSGVQTIIQLNRYGVVTGVN